MVAKKKSNAGKKLGEILLSSVPAALAPWQDKLSSVELVSAYYQPTISIIASILSVVLAIFALAVVSKSSHEKRIRWLGAATVVFCSCVIICFFLQISVDKTWVPQQEFLWLIKSFWLGAFLLAMMSLGAAVSVASMIFLENE